MVNHVGRSDKYLSRSYVISFSFSLSLSIGQKSPQIRTTRRSRYLKYGRSNGFFSYVIRLLKNFNFLATIEFCHRCSQLGFVILLWSESTHGSKVSRPFKRSFVSAQLIYTSCKQYPSLIDPNVLL